MFTRPNKRTVEGQTLHPVEDAVAQEKRVQTLVV